MGVREVYDCDRCHAREIEPVRFGVDVDRVADGAGGMEDVVERVFLCHRCAGLGLRRFLEGLSHADAAIWLETFVRCKSY